MPETEHVAPRRPPATRNPTVPRNRPPFVELSLCVSRANLGKQSFLTAEDLEKGEKLFAGVHLRQRDVDLMAEGH